MVPNTNQTEMLLEKSQRKVPADPTSISWKAADHISSPTSMAIFHLSHCCSHSFGEIRAGDSPTNGLVGG